MSKLPIVNHLFTSAEVAAHSRILTAAELAHLSLISDREALIAMEPLLRKFRPRCPACAGVLSFTPWVDGMRVASCGCGFKTKELPLAGD